ncbi:Fork head transcription factor 1 [Smittium culicis]|uniref:Fork head transcription factor 1 n=1 Tax=Smittium culicis TaxID=133412 RepID=A0A1R1YDX4_9FUNG|nr:Fork head transcription factor 1 [Smittium culicis]
MGHRSDYTINSSEENSSIPLASYPIKNPEQNFIYEKISNLNSQQIYPLPEANCKYTQIYNDQNSKLSQIFCEQNNRYSQLYYDQTNRFSNKNLDPLRDYHSISSYDFFLNTSNNISNSSFELNFFNPEQAYAKLEGFNFSYYIRSLSTTIGRSTSSFKKADVCLDDVKTISRVHNKINYSFINHRFELEVLGKNGCFINSVYLKRGSIVPLEHRSIIKIGDFEFVFLLPKSSLLDNGEILTPLLGEGIGIDSSYDFPEYYSMESITPQRLSINKIPTSNTASIKEYSENSDSFFSSADPVRCINTPTRPNLANNKRSKNLSDYDDNDCEHNHNISNSNNVSTNKPKTLKISTNKKLKYICNDDQYYSPPKKVTSPQYSAQSNNKVPNPNLRDIIGTNNIGESEKNNANVVRGTNNTIYTKPPFSYASLISEAIISSENHKLTLSEIYSFIQRKYEYYAHVQNGWQNSIRHNLSLNKAFIKISREKNEPGKGAYWAMEDEFKYNFINNTYKKMKKKLESL